MKRWGLRVGVSCFTPTDGLMCVWSCVGIYAAESHSSVLWSTDNFSVHFLSSAMTNSRQIYDQFACKLTSDLISCAAVDKGCSWQRQRLVLPRLIKSTGNVRNKLDFSFVYHVVATMWSAFVSRVIYWRKFRVCNGPLISQTFDTFARRSTPPPLEGFHRNDSCAKTHSPTPTPQPKLKCVCRIFSMWVREDDWLKAQLVFLKNCTVIY